MMRFFFCPLLSLSALVVSTVAASADMCHQVDPSNINRFGVFIHYPSDNKMQIIEHDEEYEYDKDARLYFIFNKEYLNSDVDQPRALAIVMETTDGSGGSNHVALSRRYAEVGCENWRRSALDTSNERVEIRRFNQNIEQGGQNSRVLERVLHFNAKDSKVRSQGCFHTNDKSRVAREVFKVEGVVELRIAERLGNQQAQAAPSDPNVGGTSLALVQTRGEANHVCFSLNAPVSTAGKRRLFWVSFPSADEWAPATTRLSVRSLARDLDFVTPAVEINWK